MKHTNRLADETSPYLLQHAHNPVDWHPWDDAALKLARAEDKPILLSIGYSACHWCHVMEHESFEDEQVAEFLNQHFVCIKVDREERPDLDKIYQTAHQLLTQRPGGWPLNVVVDPQDHAPFFAGTYFPKEPRYGLPGFVDVMGRVHDHFRNHRDRIPEHAAAMREALASMEPGSGTTASGQVVEQAIRELFDQYDPVHGGFGAAPKFPHPTSIELCLRYSARTGDRNAARALHVAQHTLGAMARGGLYDQLGGGFFRYSVDDKWTIPHFEKMLYDNAQLLPLYTDAWRATGDALFETVARETGAWVLREMQDRNGGYYSTLDADSEGEEGKFYTWSNDELRRALDDDEWRVIEVKFGLRGRPNFEGKWHLNVALPDETVADRCGTDSAGTAALLASARRTLFASRERRARPGRDEKILTSWNGLMARGLAHAGRFLEEPSFVDSATRAVDFVRDRMWREGRLAATTRDGRTRLNAYLDDYVFMMDALLTLLQARWRREDLDFAVSLADTVLARFRGDGRGALYFTSNDHEQLLHRVIPSSDDATPSGNGVAAQVLRRLGHLLGETRYLEAADDIVCALSAGMTRYPTAFGSSVIALDEQLAPPQTVIIRGSDPVLSEWSTIARSGYVPGRVAIAVPDDVDPLPGILASRANRAQNTAFVCTGFECKAPVTSVDEFAACLKTTGVSN